MNIICVIQTRMGSTRLPGKVLRDLQGKPMILRIIDRVSEAKTIHSIVIGVTSLSEDDAILKVVNGYPKTSVFRENPERPRDLLDLYYQSGKHLHADVVVRVTSDCPMIDPEVIDQVVQKLLDDPTIEYSSNVLGEMTFPRGLDVQAIRMSTLEHIWNIATEAEDREHVTLYVRKHPEQFKVARITHEPNVHRFRLTVDEPDDYRLISILYDRLLSSKPHFRLKDILEELDTDPDLIKINQQVQQKMSQY